MWVEPRTRKHNSQTEAATSPWKEAGDAVQVKRLIRRRIRKAGSGIDLVADVNAVVALNVDDGRRPAGVSETSTGSPAPSPDDADGLDKRGREQA
jgi:hypothetical protein